MEGRVYVCSWSYDGRLYRVWVRSRPTVCAEHASFEQADIALADAICGAFGDGEGLHEYDRSRPDTTNVPGLVTVFVILSGTSKATAENLEELYEGDRCRSCDIRPKRTSVPARLTEVEGDGGGARDTAKPWKPLPLTFFSEAFLNLLTPAERAVGDWRRVERPGRAKKVYYELVGSRLHVPVVALAPVVEEVWNLSLATARGDALTLNRCRLCGYENGPIYLCMPRGLPAWYLDESTLPSPLPPSLTTGQPPNEFRFCLPRKRWQEILGKPGTRGVTSSEVGVVASSLVDTHPARLPWPT
jgi:hypothetical protein